MINGAKRFNTGVHRATHDLVFARTSGEPGQARGITAFLVPTDTPGFTVPYYWWTFNMPTDHGEVELKDVRVPGDAVLGEVDRGLEVGQTFLHENRIRQAASSLGAAQYCIDRAVDYANERKVFGKPLAVNQAVQWPLVELQTEAQMVRLLVYYAAPQLDGNHHMEVSDKVSMANYRANRLVCEAADRAMQVFGGVGYSRHEPFEHIYRHHRRYRITEGAEEIQIRRVAQRLFGFGRQVKEQLRWRCSCRSSATSSVENLHALTGGASRTTWAFDAVGRRSTPGTDPAHRSARRRACRDGTRGRGPAARGRGGRARPAHPGGRQFACRTGQSVSHLRRHRRRDDRQEDPARPRRARPRAAAAAVRAGAGGHPPRRPRRGGPDRRRPAHRVARTARRDGRHHGHIRVGVSLAGRDTGPRRRRHAWCTAISGWAT